MKTIYILTSGGEFDPDGESKQKTTRFCNFLYWLVFNLVVSFDATHNIFRRSIRRNIQAERMIAFPNQYGRKTSLDVIANILCEPDNPIDGRDLQQFVTDELSFLVRHRGLQTYCLSKKSEGTPMIALLCDLLEEYFVGFVDYIKGQNLNHPTIDGDFAIFVLIFWYAAEQHQNMDSDSMVAQSFIEMVASIFSDVFGPTPGQNWNLKLKVWFEDNNESSTFKMSPLLQVENLEVEFQKLGANSPPSIKIGVPYFVLDILVEWRILNLEIVHPEVLMDNLNWSSPHSTSQYKFLESVLAIWKFPPPTKTAQNLSKEFNIASFDDFPPL